MDTLTQGLLGAATAQAIFAKQLPRSAGLIGMVAGMAADLDLVLGTSPDPVASILYHRQFTHSLAFIPIGGLLCSLLFLWMRRFKDRRFAVVGAALAGYATHSLLDACTSYGTLLLWPFSQQRIAWDVIAIVDPMVTLPLLTGVLWATVARRVNPARLALGFALLYLGFGVWQQHRAGDIQQRLAAARGHVIEHSRVMPAPGSLALWRSVYVAAKRLHVDGIRVPYWGGALVKEGSSAQVATIADVPLEMAERDGTQRMFEAFVWFAGGLVALVDGEPHVIGDMRYAADGSSLMPLWGMQFDVGRSDTPMRWRPPDRPRFHFVGDILHTLFRGDPTYRPIEEVLFAPQRRSSSAGTSDAERRPVGTGR